MQLIEISISLQPDTWFVLIENNGTKKKRENLALEATISELTTNKSKKEASILAIVTVG